ncbi:MAG: Uma2 family endonuclease [Gemmataceae bacterium]|nr:Uma2 family endonuclease [Gemmataceae bacterium]
MATAPSAPRRSTGGITAPARPVGAPVSRRTADLCLRIPTSACSLAGFREWVKSDEFPDEVRATFVAGEIYLDMSKEELETHNKVKGEVGRVILNLNRDLDLGEYYGDGVLVSNEEAEVSNNPDGTFFTWKALDAGRVRLVPRTTAEGQYLEIEGSPDWVMEIISDSSIKKDSQKLREAYHRAGIAEYWLIDARGEEIEFQILHWRKKGYIAAPNKEGWQRSRVFGRGFRLERSRDKRGFYRYTLHIQPA